MGQHLPIVADDQGVTVQVQQQADARRQQLGQPQPGGGAAPEQWQVRQQQPDVQRDGGVEVQDQALEVRHGLLQHRPPAHAVRDVHLSHQLVVGARHGAGRPIRRGVERKAVRVHDGAIRPAAAVVSSPPALLPVRRKLHDWRHSRGALHLGVLRLTRGLAVDVCRGDGDGRGERGLSLRGLLHRAAEVQLPERSAAPDQHSQLRLPSSWPRPTRAGASSASAVRAVTAAAAAASATRCVALCSTAASAERAVLPERDVAAADEVAVHERRPRYEAEAGNGRSAQVRRCVGYRLVR